MHCTTTQHLCVFQGSELWSLLLHFNPWIIPSALNSCFWFFGNMYSEVNSLCYLVMIFLYVCMCAHLHVSILYMYTCVCLCICMFVEARGQTQGPLTPRVLSLLFFPFSFFFLQVYVCICMRVSTCMCAHVHVCILKWGGLKLTCVLLCTLSRQCLLLNLELADSGWSG